MINFPYTFQGNPSIRIRLQNIADTLDTLAQQSADLAGIIATLENAGITNAQPYWMRKDDPTGKPDQLELTHPTTSAYSRRTGRRREYIGTDPERIAAALGRIERYKKWRIHRVTLAGVQDKMRTIENHLVALEYAATGKQQSFLDIEGAAPARSR